MRKITALLVGFILVLTPVTAVATPQSVIPGGHTLGIKLYTGGLMIIGLVAVDTDEGAVSPAENAGLMCGDVIVRINDTRVGAIEDLQSEVAHSGGESMDIVFLRKSEEMQTSLTPAMSSGEKVFKVGAWIRDSIAGIGTITFYDPDSGLFGALGHGINDNETGLLLPMGSGHVLYSEVESVRMGQPGLPGELKGSFRADREYGQLFKNAKEGIFGILDGNDAMGPDLQEAVEVCPENEVKTGPATILSNVAGDKVESYSIDIVKIFSTQEMEHSFLIHVTDPDLIAITGGIVQGMSGSPILQDGRLVGAVTHVLVNDPTRGYGLMIEEMLESGYDAAAEDSEEQAA